VYCCIDWLYPWQVNERLSDLQNEVSLLESKLKRAEDEVDAKKQVTLIYSVHVCFSSINFVKSFYLLDILFQVFRG